MVLVQYILECKQYVDQSINQNAYLLKEKESNLVFQIKVTKWNVLGGLSAVNRDTKDEGLIQTPFKRELIIFKVCLDNSN